ncbi:uncharacterized protein LOC110882767 [Helianthus annuus]|uniref:uncharacterized protein LOC110882767 n=1 Tax=Helianthus annuus TaxID=4232 RepID=UPI000B8FBEBF|nr:uncharacterized protein LOC110882767 [Helianthus annuus]
MVVPNEHVITYKSQPSCRSKLITTIDTHQLANVGSPVTEKGLVIQLLSGLSEAYGVTATILQSQKPFPNFYEARSALVLEETNKANRLSTDSALLTGSGSGANASTQAPSSGSGAIPHSSNNRGSRAWGRGRGCGSGQFQNWSSPPVGAS